MSSIPPEVVQVFGAIFGVAVGGYISWRISSSTLRLTMSHTANAEEVKYRRQALYERLQMQRGAYQEFLALCAKHQKRNGSPGGISGKLQVEKEDAALAHIDAVNLYAKLVLAFGSKDFAGQAAQVVETISAVRGTPILELEVTALFATQYMERMQQAIEATEKQLNLPTYALVPDPVVPQSEFNKEFKRHKLRDIAQQHGLDPKRVDEIMLSLEQRRTDFDESTPEKKA